LKIIGVKEIPHWGKKSLECESMHVMHYEKEVMYACNMCMHTHRQNSTLNMAHIIVTNLDMSYMWWAEKYG